MEESPRKSTSTDISRNHDATTSNRERYERRIFTAIYEYLPSILTFLLDRIQVYPRHPKQQRLSLQTQLATNPQSADCPSHVEMKPLPPSMSRKSLADMRSAALKEFANSSMDKDEPVLCEAGKTFAGKLPESTIPRHNQRMSLDHTLLSLGRNRGDSSSSLGSPITLKKTNISSPGSVSPKSKLPTSVGHATVTKAKAPVLQTELRANRHKQSHSVDSVSNPLAGSLTIKNKSRPSNEIITSGASHLEDLFYSPPDRKSKDTLTNDSTIPMLESSASLQAPKQCSSPLHSPTRSNLSFKTALKPMDHDFPGASTRLDTQKMEIRPRLSADRNVTGRGVSSPIRRRPNLQIVTEGLTKLGVDESGGTEREWASEVALTNFTPPTSVVSDTATTSSSIDNVVDRTSRSGLRLGQRKPLNETNATPKHIHDEQCVNPSPLRPDAMEFVPGRAFSPTPAYRSDCFTGSPPIPVSSGSTYTVDSSVAATIPLPAIAQSLYADIMTLPSPDLPQNWLPTMLPGLTAPYRYIPSGVPSHGIIDPSRVIGLQRADWRAKNPVPCDILSVDENTLQPAGYPGHTALEWREISLAIADYNRKQGASPIPTGVDARARFFQPGRAPAATAMPLRGGGSAAPAPARCLCGGPALHAPQHHASAPRCLHCGSSGHALSACTAPPLFSGTAPQHATLARYLRTAGWRARAGGAPTACAVCPARHAAEEVALVVERVVRALAAAGEDPPAFDWRGFWVADFSQCPVVWALRPVDQPGRLFVALNPVGNVAVRELVVAAGEALKATGHGEGVPGE